MSEGDRAEERGGEHERKLDWIDTPKGRVPSFESTEEAFKEVENYLNELYERVEKVEGELTSTGGKASEELVSEIKRLREAVESINAKIKSLEEMIQELNEKQDVLDYLTELIERSYKGRVEEESVT